MLGASLSLGYDILRPENILPGKFTATVFGFKGNGRMYLKPEEHGADFISNPADAYSHTIGYFSSARARGGAVKVRAEAGIGRAGVEHTRKEHRVEDPELVKKYQAILQEKIDYLTDQGNVLGGDKKAEAKLAALIAKLKKEKEKPKGNLKAMREVMLRDEGIIQRNDNVVPNTVRGMPESERKTLVDEFDAIVRRKHIRDNEAIESQYGEEVSLKFTRERLQAALGSPSAPNGQFSKAMKEVTKTAKNQAAEPDSVSSRKSGESEFPQMALDTKPKEREAPSTPLISPSPKENEKESESRKPPRPR